MKIPTQTFRNSVTVPLIAAAVLFFCGCKSPAPAGQDQIQTEFEKVPEAVKPWAYWYWMDDNVSKQGITDDLESMAEIGIKEVFIGNIGATMTAKIKKQINFILIRSAQIIGRKPNAFGTQMIDDLLNHKTFPTGTDPGLRKQVVHGASLH